MVWTIEGDKIGIGRSLEYSISRGVKFDDVAIPWSADGYAREIDIIFPMSLRRIELQSMVSIRIRNVLGIKGR